MDASPNEIYLIELLLFYGLALGILFLPVRWSLLCLLLAGCVEVMPVGFVSTASVSWQNVAGRLILPAFLLLRLARFRLPRIRWGFSAKAWITLVLYAAISIAWSPFKLSALKMVAYLAAWFVLYLVFHVSWRTGLLNQRMVIAALWGSLALACLQTYGLGNPLWGNQFGQFASAQFAPFTGPQSFAPFLACLLALLLFSRERHTFRLVSVGACLVALVLVGSRYSLIEAGIVLFAWCLMWAHPLRKTGGLRLSRVLGILALTVTVFFGFRVMMAWASPGSRVNQLFDVESQSDALEGGTFGWRLLVYQRTISALSQKSLAGLIFGSGTSSGGEVATKGQADRDVGVDPNRTIHDEFLRAEYEWGFIGLASMLSLLIYAVHALWVRSFRLRSLASFAALAVMPGIVLALLVENPLADPGTAESFGYVMVLTYGFAFSRRIFESSSFSFQTPRSCGSAS